MRQAGHVSGSAYGDGRSCGNVIKRIVRFRPSVVENIENRILAVADEDAGQRRPRCFPFFEGVLVYFSSFFLLTG